MFVYGGALKEQHGGRKKEMRKITAIMFLSAILLMGGCAGTQINWNIDKQVVAEVAANEIGYQLVQEYPEVANVALAYAKMVTEATEPGYFNDRLNIWKEYVLRQVGLDRHYTRQLSKLMPEIELSEDALPDMKWMETVKPYVEEFIIGIEDGLPEISFIQRYAEIYEANWLKFLWERSLGF